MAHVLFVAARSLLSSCGIRVFSSLVVAHVGSVVCGTQALVEARKLSSCGAQA